VDAYNVRAMHWMVDGYNVIRRDPALASQDALSLEAGRDALCRLLARAARDSGETFTVVFDGAGRGGAGTGGGAVRVIFRARARAPTACSRAWRPGAVRWCRTIARSDARPSAAAPSPSPPISSSLDSSVGAHPSRALARPETPAPRLPTHRRPI
jgi:hypothetical protein